MKKAYSKPAITFESFQMSSSIANTCGDLKANAADGNSCELIDGGFSIFNSGKNEECDPYGCYHVAPDPSTVFGS